MVDATIQYRADIDGLRAVAVLLVVLYHVSPNTLPGGFIGVDIFFVISGFLITKIVMTQILSGGFSFGLFYAKRVIRIVPALLLVTFTTIALGWFILLPEEYIQLAKHAMAATSYTSNVVYSNEVGYFNREAIYKPLLHTWSLAIEGQFYFLYPLFLIGFTRITRNKPYVFWLSWLILLLTCFFLNWLLVTQDSEKHFFSFQTRAWELMVGGTIALATPAFIQQFFRQKHDVYIKLFGFSLIILGAYVTVDQNPFPGWYALLPVLGTALVILSPHSRFNTHILGSRTLVFIGKRSYPIYLWHWPLLSFSHSLGIKSYPAVTFVVALSFLFAHITYCWLERPIQNPKHCKNRTAIILLCCTFMLFSASYFIAYKDGIPSRFPSNVHKLINYQFKEKEPGSFSTNPTLYPCHQKFQAAFKITQECKTKVDLRKKTIFVWGDSYATHLKYGLYENYPDYNIIIYGRGSCTPEGSYKMRYGKECKKFNRHVANEILRVKPDTLLLAASWSGRMSGAPRWKKLQRKILQFQSNGIKDIYLVGPAPFWPENLKSKIVHFMKKHDTDTFPQRMYNPMHIVNMREEKEVRLFAETLRLKFISILDILCIEAGCLTKVGPDFEHITAWDHAHFTIPTSVYVVSRFPDL